MTELQAGEGAQPLKVPRIDARPQRYRDVLIALIAFALLALLPRTLAEGLEKLWQARNKLTGRADLPFWESDAALRPLKAQNLMAPALLVHGFPRRPDLIGEGIGRQHVGAVQDLCDPHRSSLACGGQRDVEFVRRRGCNLLNRDARACGRRIDLDRHANRPARPFRALHGVDKAGEKAARRLPGDNLLVETRSQRCCEFERQRFAPISSSAGLAALFPCNRHEPPPPPIWWLSSGSSTLSGGRPPGQVAGGASCRTCGRNGSDRPPERRSRGLWARSPIRHKDRERPRGSVPYRPRRRRIAGLAPRLRGLPAGRPGKLRDESSAPRPPGHRRKRDARRSPGFQALFYVHSRRCPPISPPVRICLRYAPANDPSLTLGDRGVGNRTKRPCGL